MRKTNIEGTANIVNLSLYNNIKKLCYVSSIAALGHAKLPDEYIDENSEWNPEFALDGYAISKHGAELEVWRAQEEGLATIIVNPGIIIGAGFWNQGSGLLFSKIKKGHYFYTLGTNGYVGVHDVVKIMLTLMEKETTGENYVLVSENLSYKQVFDLIATYLKVNKPKYYARPWMTALAFHLKNMLQYAHTQTKYDNKKITTQLEYVFEPIEKSIKDTAEMYR
jgi:nucleoside-diphosphate-sugar epimerase